MAVNSFDDRYDIRMLVGFYLCEGGLHAPDVRLDSCYLRFYRQLEVVPTGGHPLG